MYNIQLSSTYEQYYASYRTYGHAQCWVIGWPDAAVTGEKDCAKPLIEQLSIGLIALSC